MKRWILGAAPMLALLASCGSNETPDSFVNVWTVERTAWTDQEEQGFSTFVAQIGTARADRRCSTLQECLASQSSNPLWTADDRNTRAFADCADLPYILRAYYAFKRKLPFEFRYTEGSQYSNGNEVGGGLNQTSVTTLARLFTLISEGVHTGAYRMRPSAEKTDTFPTAVNRTAIRPGTTYYDPNGHVLLVYKVESNGIIRFIDGHPDNSVSVKTFGTEIAAGNSTNGGGFRNFRRYTQGANGTVTRLANASHPDFSETEQYKSPFSFQGQTLSYHEYVKAKLSSTGTSYDPVQEFRERVKALCEDTQSRVKAVQDAVDAGVSRQPHPGRIPANIYLAENPWEAYSSPGRDSRLRTSLQGLRKYVDQTYKAKKSGDANLISTGTTLAMLESYRGIWNELRATTQCQFTYKKSDGSTKTLTLEDIFARAFTISFDPYHCPELRWGATGSEAASCPSDATKQSFYAWEKNIRNSIERISTPNATSGEAILSSGRATAEDVDAPALLKALIQAETNGTAPVVNVVVGEIACPEGFQKEAIGTEGGQLCTDGTNAIGPFTKAMVEKCISWGGGQEACSSQRWSVRLAKNARGTGVCPLGAQLDPVTTYCVEGSDAFGPFPQAVVEKCRARGGGSACGSARWSREFLRGILGR